MNLRNLLLCLVVLLLSCPCAEPKKKKKRIEQKKLRELCRLQRRSKSPLTALELHAYFDLQPQKKPFACLKVTTCRGKPVCFVTTHPNLKKKSINDTTTWQDLITFIQRDRKIEPIYDRSMSEWNGDRYKALGQYIQDQPPIYRMCRHAAIYRFVINENVTNTTINATKSSSNSTGSTPLDPSLPLNANPAMTLCPLFKSKTRIGRRRKGKSMRIKRVDRSKNKTTDNFFQCQGFDCPCVRICVGQGSKQNFSECSTFRIICTFNCGSNTIVVPKNPIVTRPTKQATKRATKRPRKRPTKRPTRRSRKRHTKRPTRRPRKQPTKRPTRLPRKRFTKRPTRRSTKRPTKRPTRRPRRPGRNKKTRTPSKG